ncbi:MAG: hypothetical protein WCF65_08155 [Parachlamydiaceae bacterium]
MDPLVTVLIFVLAGVMMYYIAIAFSEWVVGRKISARFLLKNFGQKMWMTTGLGLFFAAIYLLVIFGGSYLFDEKSRLSLLLLMYKQPVDFIYLGLLTFACASLLIYFARMVIIHLYNTRNF